MEEKGKDLFNRHGYSARTVPLRDNMTDEYKITSVIKKMNNEQLFTISELQAGR